MAESANILFDCPGCGKHFNWTPELTGKKIKCGCGAIMIGPAKPGDVYDVAEEPAMAAPVVRASRSDPLPPGAIAPLDAGRRVLGYRSKGARTDTVLEAEVVESRLWEFWLPLGLLITGLLLQLGVAIYDGVTTGEFGRSIAAAAVSGLINFVLMFGGVLFIGKTLDVAFGERSRAILKIAAIGVFPAGVAALLMVLTGHDWTGRAIGGFCLLPGITYVLLLLFFATEVGATILCTIYCFLIYNWVTVSFLRRLFPTDL
jgi:hypothetical protein